MTRGRARSPTPRSSRRAAGSWRWSAPSRVQFLGSMAAMSPATTSAKVTVDGRQAHGDARRDARIPRHRDRLESRDVARSRARRSAPPWWSAPSTRGRDQDRRRPRSCRPRPRGQREERGRPCGLGAGATTALSRRRPSPIRSAGDTSVDVPTGATSRRQRLGARIEHQFVLHALDRVAFGSGGRRGGRLQRLSTSARRTSAPTSATRRVDRRKSHRRGAVRHAELVTGASTQVGNNFIVERLFGAPGIRLRGGADDAAVRPRARHQGGASLALTTEQPVRRRLDRRRFRRAPSIYAAGDVR